MPSRSATALLLLAAQVSCIASEQWTVLEIPPTIETRQELVAAPPGWTASQSDLPCLVAGITVFDGPPEQQVSLVPGDVYDLEEPEKMAAVWQLAPPSGERSWVSLSYSCTSIVLSSPLPAEAIRLRVIYDSSEKVSGLNAIMRVEYR